MREEEEEGKVEERERRVAALSDPHVHPPLALDSAPCTKAVPSDHHGPTVCIFSVLPVMARSASCRSRTERPRCTTVAKIVKARRYFLRTRENGKIYMVPQEYR